MLSRRPKYPRRRTVYMDCITFFFACLNVLLKEPRLTAAFVRLKLAFSSYFTCFEAMLSTKASISIVSSCIIVKWLFFASILAIGSPRERFSQFWTFFLSDRLNPHLSILVDTLLYTS